MASAQNMLNAEREYTNKLKIRFISFFELKLGVISLIIRPLKRMPR
jgi:hypothetical protein